MKYIKTYGINGLLEWHGIIESGSIKLKVSFVNGSVTANGVAPASFTTKNELIQAVIENSEMFKTGRIYVYRSSAIPGSDKVVEAPKSVVAEEPSVKPAAIDSNTEEKVDETAGEVADEVAVIEVADKGEAVEWLKENYPMEGYTASKLRLKGDFESACKKHGVTFKYI